MTSRHCKGHGHLFHIPDGSGDTKTLVSKLMQVARGRAQGKLACILSADEAEREAVSVLGCSAEGLALIDTRAASSTITDNGGGDPLVPKELQQHNEELVREGVGEQRWSSMSEGEQLCATRVTGVKCQVSARCMCWCSGWATSMQP